nr:MAG: hypothetical protein [Bacteriophage sp.]
MHENCEEDNYGYCNGNASEYVEKSVHIVEQWAKDHPVKTRQSEFLKMFPNAPKSGRVLDICPKNLNTEYMPPKRCENISCSACKTDYWNKEVTDNDKYHNPATRRTLYVQKF